MTFEFWPDLIDELKIEVLSQLARMQQLPTLNRFTLTSRAAKDFSQDTMVWQEMIRAHFPALESNLPSVFRANAFALYKKTYLCCKKALQEHQIPMSAYFKALSGDFAGLNPTQVSWLMVCMLMLGKSQHVDVNIANNYPKAEKIKLATQLGLAGYVQHLLTLKNEPVETASIRSAMLSAAELGHTQIVSVILTCAGTWLDAGTIRKAGIAAASTGHFDTLTHLLTHAGSYFDLNTKAQIFKEAVMHGHVNMMALILHHARLSVPCLRESFMLAIEHGQCAAVGLILENAPLQISTSARLDGIRLALKNQHEDIALLLIEQHWTHLSASRRLAILKEAATKGMLKLTSHMLAKEEVKLTKAAKFDLICAVCICNQPLVLKYLLERFGQDLTPKEKGYIAQTPCFKQCGLDETEPEDEVAGVVKRLSQLSMISSPGIENFSSSFTPMYRTERSAPLVPIQKTGTTRVFKI